MLCKGWRLDKATAGALATAERRDRTMGIGESGSDLAAGRRLMHIASRKGNTAQVWGGRTVW